MPTSPLTGAKKQASQPAVIVIHGVADQKPGDTLRAVVGELSARTWTSASWSTLTLPHHRLNDGIGAETSFDVRTGTLLGKTPIVLYELHWADLSRARRSLLGMVSSIVSALAAFPLQSLRSLTPSLETSGPRTLCYAVAYVAYVVLFGLVLPLMFTGVGAALLLPLLDQHWLETTWYGPLVGTAVALGALGGILAVASRSVLVRSEPIQAAQEVAAVTSALCVMLPIAPWSDGEFPGLLGVSVAALADWTSHWLALLLGVGAFAALLLFAGYLSSRHLERPAGLGSRFALVSSTVVLSFMVGRMGYGFPLPTATVAFALAWVLLGKYLFRGLAGSQQESAAGREEWRHKINPARWESTLYRLIQIGWIGCAVVACTACAVFWLFPALTNACFASTAVHLSDSVALVLQMAYVLACVLHAFTGTVFAFLSALMATAWAACEVSQRQRSGEVEARQSWVRFSSALRTTVVTICGAYVGVVVLAIPLLCALSNAIQSVLPNDSVSPIILGSLMAYRSPLAANEGTLRELLPSMVAAAGTSMFPLVLALLCVFGAIVVVYIVPIVTAIAWRTPPGTRTRKSFEYLREWTNEGLDAVLWGTFFPLQLMLLGLGCWIEIAIGADWGIGSERLASWREVAAPLVGRAIPLLGVVLAGSASVLAMPSRFRNGLLELWPVLDVIGDVQTYFDEAAFGRIKRRTARLFEHVDDLHDLVVVVAHSQGSVIACEVLRGRQSVATRDQSVRPTTRLITCGSPLGHLYHRFFTNQVAWLEDALRDPKASLGVDCWRNVSAPGDFVGMTIARTTVMRELAVNPAKNYREVSAGGSAVGHNEYLGAREIVPMLTLCAVRGKMEDRDKAPTEGADMQVESEPSHPARPAGAE